jgi:hypothetical protein
MKTMSAMATLLAVLAFPVAAQDRPAAVIGEEVEAIVTVRAIDQETRMVTLATEDGRETTLHVPEAAHNLYQVHAGSRFKVRYREAVAIGVTDSGEAPSAEAAEVVERAPLGANPAGAIAQIVRITARVEAIDYQSRRVAVRGPQGNLREFVVSDEVQRLDEVEVGDLVEVVFAEALALEMIPE